MSETTGILVNTPNIYDASLYKTNQASLIIGEEYHNNTAITCDAPGVTIFDTGIIKAGTFGGTYAIGFFYDSTIATVQGTPLMRFEIYEDGVLIPETITQYSYGTYYSFDLNYVNHVLTVGLFQTFVLKANKTYQIIVKTVNTLEHDVILDYVILEKIPTNVITAKNKASEIGLRNDGNIRNILTEGSQLELEIVTGSINGTFTPGYEYTAGYTYTTNFKQIMSVFPTVFDGNGYLNYEWDGNTNYSTKQVSIFFKNITGSNWEGVGDNVRLVILGYI